MMPIVHSNGSIQRKTLLVEGRTGYDCDALLLTVSISYYNTLLVVIREGYTYYPGQLDGDERTIKFASLR
jgi:hypothetical protein